jgi:hypothetical protein
MSETPVPFSDSAERLAEIIRDAEPRLVALKESHTDQPLRDEAWSRKQILGHLIDSAANNHQRFVRAQEADEYRGPKYAQQHWVNTQRYDARSWGDLVALWSAYNRHLAHVISHIPPEKALIPCFIGDDAPVSLAFIAEDYVTHLEHHLKQILG